MPEPTIDEMKALIASYEELKKAISDSTATEAMKAAFQKMTPLVDSFKRNLLSGAGAAKGLSDAVKDLSVSSFVEGLQSMGRVVEETLESISPLIKSLKGVAVELASLYLLGSGRLGVSRELASLGNEAEGTSASMAGMFETISNVAPELVAGLGKAGEGLKRALGQVDAVKKLETGLLMSAAASGNLDAAMESLGGSMTNLSDMTLDFSRLTSEVGTANGMTAGETAKYARELMKIPGALAMVIDGTGEGRDQMNMLDATIKVAAGTFQPFSDVMKDVDLLFKNWNKTGKESLDFVARMSSAAQSLKMPMDIMRGYVHGVGEQFKFLGDNTMSAIDIMTRFEPAFQQSGLGPAAIAQLVQGMTGAVSQMDVAQRAFVSARTGGPGGLQGGYQLAQQMAEGDMAGVFGKVEETLKGMFGGQVVTLKQASEDARAAAQFTKQVQMLTTGPLKIANTEAEAFKILDAFASGTMPDVEAAGAAEDPLERAMNRGNDIQDRQYNELVSINNQLENYGALAADVAYAGFRRGIGPGADYEQERRLRTSREREEAGAAAAGRRFQEEIPGKGREEEVGGLIGGAFDMVNKFVTAVTGEPEERQQLGAATVTVEPPAFLEAERARRARGLEGPLAKSGEYRTVEDIDHQLGLYAEEGRRMSPRTALRRDLAQAQPVEERRYAGTREERGPRREAPAEQTVVLHIKLDRLDEAVDKTVKIAINADKINSPYS